MSVPYATRLKNLPEMLPILPLEGGLLLPRCGLPLNIFEPRYLRMMEDALAGDRLIGMVQPLDVEPDRSPPEIFKTGCAGRITSFTETDDGRIMIILTGVCRFEVVAEGLADLPYRRVVVDWGRFCHDLVAKEGVAIERERLFDALGVYFDTHGLDTDWDLLREASDEYLVNSLAMSCPFDSTERQALLEALGLAQRAKLLRLLLKMGSFQQPTGGLSIQ